MPLFQPLINSSSLQAALQGGSGADRVATTNTEMIVGQASEAISLGVFPVEAAFVILGCLIVSSFALLIRETRIENRQN